MIRLLLASLSFSKVIRPSPVFPLLVLLLGSLSVHAQNAHPALPLSGVTQVALGYEHSCALTTSGGVKCWGRGSAGQLGNDTTNNRLIAVDVAGLTSGVRAIASGENHTCALLTTGGVKCWGDNSNGALGNNSVENSPLPVDVIGGENMASLVAGASFSCALTTSGGVKCWGSNSAGKLGDGSTATRMAPVDVVGLTSGVMAISAGTDYACALTNQGAVKCWGSNFRGALGSGSQWPSYQATPVSVSGLGSGVTKLFSRYTRSCAVLASGVVKCWGSNNAGQLGDGTTTDQYAPVTAALDFSVSAIAISDSGTCGLTTSGGVKCWGNGAVRDIAGLQSDVLSLDAGIGHICAASAPEGNVVCWGSGNSGQLGNNNVLSSATPVGVIQATLPGSPTAVTVVPYNSHAILSFNPISNQNNLADTRYTVISEPAGAVDMNEGTLATTRQMRGLVNGVGYRFYVVAQNIMGDSTPSEASNTVIPMANYYRLPTGCILDGELIPGITLSVALDGCRTAQTSPFYHRDFYAFDAAPGDQVAVTIRATGFTPTVMFRDPYSIQFGYGRSFGATGRYPSEGYVTLGASGVAGIYLVEISSNQSGYSGSYTISLEKNTSVSSSSAPASSSSSVRSSSSAISSSSDVASSSQNSSSSAVASSSSAPGAVSSSSVNISSVNSSSLNSSAANNSSTDNSSSAASESSLINSSVMSSSVFSSSAISSSISSAISSLAGGSSSSVSAGPCAAVALTFGVTNNGNLSSSDCTSGARGTSYYTDRYSFTGTPGQQITILLTSTAFDSYVYLKNPSGTVIASDDDGGGGRNSRIPSGSGSFTLPAGATGTYIVEVTSYSTNTTGSYSLSVTSSAVTSSSVSSASSASVTSASSSSAVNPCTVIGSSVLNVTVMNSLATSDCNSGVRGSGYYTDRYSFTATQGQTVVIQLNSTAFDTYLYLKNSSGTIVASNDDSGGGTNSRIPANSGVLTITTAGTYTIEVTSYSMGSTGAYTLFRSQN